MQAISTHSLTKRFGATTALDDVSIQIQQGEIYGCIGLNGAGKTTLIRILLGMIAQDAGQVKLLGQVLTKNFRQWNDIGYLVETPQAYPDLSVTENLKVYYQLRQLKNRQLITEIIAKLNLNRYADTKAKHLSLGNKQRLGLAKALMHKPKLLLLDEPSNGLDPEGIVEVRKLLQELVEEGTTVFLSSHILGEISKIANRISIIHQGKIIKDLNADELSDQLIKKVLIRTGDNAKALHYLQHNHQAILNENDEIELTDQQSITRPEQITQLLVEKGLPPKQVYLFTEELEDFFLRTIKN